MVPERKAFTLIELLVVVAIIALLVSILVPALNEARSVAKRSVCATNIHSLVLGVNIYYNDHNEIPGGSNYQRYATNYFALHIGYADDAMEMTTGDFTALYPAYVDAPDAYYCPDSIYTASDNPWSTNENDTIFCFWAPWHGIMGRYITYDYYGRGVPDGFGRNPAIDIDGDVTEVPESLLDASPDAVLMADWGWYSSALGLHTSANHPPYHGNGAFPGRDGINSGHVDGSVAWVDDSETIARLYIHSAYWHKY